MEGMEMNPLPRFYDGKRVLVSGHSGFKGAWLSRILIGMGAKVSGYSLDPNTKPNLFSEMQLGKKMHSHIADIRDYGGLSAVFAKEKPELVFHLAAQPLVRKSYDEPLETFSTNVIGTANVLECIRQNETVRSAVIVTTDKVYENDGSGRPFKETDRLGGKDPYAASKACAELVSRSYSASFFKGKRIATARAGNVIGGGDWSEDRIVPDMIRSIFEKKGTLRLRNPGSVRPWQHVLDPLFGYLMLAKKLHEGEAEGEWNFAPEPEGAITVEELVRRSIALLGKGSYAVSPQEGKPESALLRLDASKAKKHLGWKSRLGIDESLEWTMEWYRAFYEGKDGESIASRQIDDYMGRI